MDSFDKVAAFFAGMKISDENVGGCLRSAVGVANEGASDATDAAYDGGGDVGQGREGGGCEGDGLA